jgi:hypothetical protein
LAQNYFDKNVEIYVLFIKLFLLSLNRKRYLFLNHLLSFYVCTKANLLSLKSIKMIHFYFRPGKCILPKRTIVFFLLFVFKYTYSTNFTAVADGNWDTFATWGGSSYPVAGDTVTIESGKTVTVNILNAACSSLNIGTGGPFAGNGTLNFSSGSQLTVSGATAVGASLNNGTINMSSGGTLISGSLDLGFPGNGHFTAGTGTIKFTNTFTLPADVNFNSFNNLEILSGTTSFGTAAVVAGNLTMSNTGILNSNHFDLAVHGDWTQSGTASFTEGTRTVTFNGSSDQYINHTSTETFANLVVNKTSGKLILNSGSVSVLTLLTISNGTFDAGTNSLSGAGGLTMTSGDLQLAQLSSVCSCTLPRFAGAYTISGGTITFKGAGAQIIRGETVSAPVIPNYNDVIIKGSGTKTLEGNLDVNGSLSIQETAELDVSASDLSISLAGNWSNTSTYASPDAFNERNGKVTFDGTNAVSLTSTSVTTGETFYDLTMDKTVGTDNLSLNNEVTVTHLLTLTMGHLLTSPSSRNLTIDSTAIAVTGGNDNSFIDGPVTKRTNATTPYVLPTGKISPNGEYRWMSITPSSNTATTYVAEYFYSIPSNNTDVGPGVNRVSELEKWTLQRPSGSADAKVELSWSISSVVNSNITDLLVVQDDGTPGPRWINKCSCTTTGSLNNGSIQTLNDVTLFGTSYPLSLGSPHATNNELGDSRYSVDDGNWDNTATWATRSGGPAGATTPSNTKRVIIEAGKRVDVNVAAAALKLTLGNNGTGILDFNATANSLTVGPEGVIVTSNSDVEGTNASAILRTSGDISLDADISVESSDNTTASTFGLLRETNANKIFSGTGIVTNFTNNASTILTGNLTVKQTFNGSTAIINAGAIALKGTAAQITGNLIDATTVTPNTIEFDNMVANFDFASEIATYSNLILSGNSVKQPGVPWTVNGDLTLNSGVTLDQDANDNDIVIRGNWINLGATFTPSTTASTEVTFSGTAEQTIRSGGSAFGNLIINNSSATGVVLQDAMTIGSNKKLTLTDGYVFLGNNNLVLQTPNVNIGTPTSGSFIVTGGTGTLGIEAVTTSRTFPVGSQGTANEYTPVTVSNTGTSDRFDVKVCDFIYVDGTCSGSSPLSTRAINKTWNIEEHVIGGSDAALTLQWNAANELPGFDRNAMFISHYTGGAWMQQQAAGAVSGSGPFTKSLTAVTSFSPFGVGSAGSPLPIELLGFNAILNGDAVALDWTTASEKNNDYFVVERTADAMNYTSIATIQGAGNSDGMRHYSTTDNQPLQGTSYYRLRQVDFDGVYSLSNMVPVNYLKSKGGISFILYPNPASEKTNVFVYNAVKGQQVDITVYDISGKVVYASATTSDKSEDTFSIDLGGNLSAGVYLVVLHSGDQTSRQKLSVLSSEH